MVGLTFRHQPPAAAFGGGRLDAVLGFKLDGQVFKQMASETVATIDDGESEFIGNSAGASATLQTEVDSQIRPAIAEPGG